MADRARAEFEKWVKNPHMLGRCHAPGSEDRYEVSETQYAWRAWQAAIARQREWIESAGHRPDCRSRLCACGSDWCGEGIYRNGHYFKFGPCDCGYSELTEN